VQLHLKLSGRPPRGILGTDLLLHIPFAECGLQITGLGHGGIGTDNLIGEEHGNARSRHDQPKKFKVAYHFRSPVWGASAPEILMGLISGGITAQTRVAPCFGLGVDDLKVIVSQGIRGDTKGVHEPAIGLHHEETGDIVPFDLENDIVHVPDDEPVPDGEPDTVTNLDFLHCRSPFGVQLHLKSQG
jgi:hypothetical protein